MLLGLATAAGLASAQGPLMFSAQLVGYEEIPALSTPGQGSIRVAVSPDNSSLSYELEYSGIPTTVVQSHIHFGQMSVNGGIMVFLCSNLGNGPAGTQPCPQAGRVTGTLVAGEVVGPGAQGIAAGEFAEVLAALRAGHAYANVHSQERPGGEIRGQLSMGVR
jgi:hypothetical protein